MGVRHVRVGETDAERLRVYFTVWLLGGGPAESEAGGQPQLSLNGAAFDSNGIGTLTAIGFGRYYAQLASSVVIAPGDVINTRYKSGITGEAEGDTFLVVSATDSLPVDVRSVSHYGTVFDGDVYFNSGLFGQRWKASSPSRKLQGLISATQIIDRLNYAGSKAESSQVLQFPRGNTYTDIDGTVTITKDVVVPEAVKQATYLIANRLLDGWDPDLESDNLAATGNRIDRAETKYQRDFIPEHMRAGIPSARAWSLLKPYLRDSQEITLVRV